MQTTTPLLGDILLKRYVTDYIAKFAQQNVQLAYGEKPFDFNEVLEESKRVGEIAKEIFGLL
jgi:hypothetical protein